MSADRDLATAIYAEITSDHSAADALRLWLDPGERHWGRDADDMRAVLACVAASAIDTVLARRLREAARTGPWENDGQFVAYAGTDARKWAAEFCRIARDHGHDLDEGWVIGWFANAIEHARTGPWDEPVRAAAVDPTNGGTSPARVRGKEK